MPDIKKAIKEEEERRARIWAAAQAEDRKKYEHYMSLLKNPRYARRKVVPNEIDGRDHPLYWYNNRAIELRIKWGWEKE